MDIDQLESLIEWIYTSALFPVLWSRTVDAISQLTGKVERPQGDGTTDTKSYLGSLQRHLQTAEWIHDALREDLDQRGIGQLLLDEDGRVAICDDIARSCLERGGFSIDSGMLKAEMATQQELLDDAVKTVLIEEATALVIAFNRIERSTPLIARFSSIGLEAVDDILSPAKGVLVHLRDPEDFGHIDQSRLQALFNLTERESRLALAIVRGQSLSTYALANDVTRETARSHVKSLFRKVGVRRQAQLVSVLLNALH